MEEGVSRLAEFDLFGTTGRILTAIILIPYFGWGVYTLRLRFRYHEDLTPVVEAATLLGVAVFFAIETLLLKAYLYNYPAFFIFAVLGLVVSGAALYGPMVVSLISQLVVDVMVPGERSKTREPRYEPAEVLEREGDYKGALDEYLVIARIFPREPSVLIRIADTYVALDQAADAAQWFERALKLLDSPERSLQVTNRLCEIYRRQLDAPQEVARLLEAYLRRYPNAEFAGSVQERLNQLNASV